MELYHNQTFYFQENKDCIVYMCMVYAYISKQNYSYDILTYCLFSNIWHLQYYKMVETRDGKKTGPSLIPYGEGDSLK